MLDMSPKYHVIIFFRDGKRIGDDYDDDDGYDWKPSVPIKFTKKCVLS